MLNLRKEISLRQKLGIILSSTFLTLSLGSVPAIANDVVDEPFTVDLFEEVMLNSSREVTINGITFDKENLVISQLENYDKLSNKAGVVRENVRDYETILVV